jgi:hypothetical protein
MVNEERCQARIAAELAVASNALYQMRMADCRPAAQIKWTQLPSAKRLLKLAEADILAVQPVFG